MRKILIALISLAVVVLGFWSYVALIDTAPIQILQSQDVQELDMPKSGAAPQPTGDTTLEAVGRTRYFKYDPVTREIAAEYGFGLLLNPGRGSSRWQVEKPYLVFYQQGYQYRVDSERGTFQVEMVGSQSVPKDAQLEENVVIHITPRPGFRIAETTIRMDDLTFSSERSEFATDGPVTIESSQIRMEGYGLIVIFNAGVGKIEYLQIKDLDFLRLKGLASSLSPLTVKPSRQAGEGKKQHPVQQDKQAAEGLPVNEDSVPQVAASESPTLQERAMQTNASDFYQCAIRDNVIIEYGNELIVSGADQVNIQNILFSAMNDAATSDEATNEENAPGESETAAAPLPRAGSVANQPDAAPSPMDVPATDDSQDVVVRCDGGMIIQPMQTAESSENNVSDSDLAFEMSGTPLKVDRVLGSAGNGSETLAHCGSLSYKPAEDILRLFTNPFQPQILLSTQQSGSRIETSGDVLWDRKAQRANITGPGKVYIGDVKNPAALPSEISFKGMMDLLFAQMPDPIASATIQTINLTGGMDAILRRNGTLKTLADSAVLEFGQSNRLSEARLDGDVRFESLQEGKAPSQAAAESAVFYFENNQITAADLNGKVHFASAGGHMDSSNARIEFEPDASGTMHPKVIRTDSQTVLQMVPAAAGQPPAKFEAKRIDYDLQTGSGLAQGPIQFTFYQPSDPNQTDVGLWTPITITADQKAQFLADADQNVNQIVFNENVIAIRLVQNTLFTRQDEFHGDKLIVDIGKNSADSTEIRKITFTEGKVFGQSIKMHGEKKLFHVRMTCREMSYDELKDVVLATGPGKIELDNSKAEPAAANSGVNFQRSCYAFIDGFNTIRWNLNTQEIAADGDENTMRFVYVPLVDGKEEKYIYVYSRQIEAGYLRDSSGKPVIQHVFSDKAVNYTEMDQFNRKILLAIVGQTLEYDAVSDVGRLTITGSEANPVFLNGNRVPAIRYNINTGQVETSISPMPGVLGIPK